MALRDSIKDIVKHTHSLGFINKVKITGKDGQSKIEAIDDDKTVVMYGTMNEEIADLADSEIGLTNMAVLNGYLNIHPNDSTLEFVTEDRQGEIIPTELKFANTTGLISNYRFMSKVMVADSIKVPPFRGVKWNVTIKPERKSIATLAAVQGILGGSEKKFTVSLSAKQVLNFTVGSGPTDRTVIPFATGVTGDLKHQWSWPLSQVLSILKLADTSDTTIHVSDSGAMMIEIDSGIGAYQYILPGMVS